MTVEFEATPAGVNRLLRDTVYHSAYKYGYWYLYRMGAFVGKRNSYGEFRKLVISAAKVDLPK